jgi:5'-nucleotidase
MSNDLNETLVIAISATALFDLSEAHQYFTEQLTKDPNNAVENYRQFMRTRENDALKDGTGMPLVKALLALNKDNKDNKPFVEVVVLSRNSSETGLRVGHNIKKLDLPILRSVYSSGESVVPYLSPFKVDLFLTTSFEDAQKVIDTKLCAAAVLEPTPAEVDEMSDQEIRIAFDGDAVIFDESSELVYKTSDLEAFMSHEKENQAVPLPEGPYARFIKKLGLLKTKLITIGKENCIKTALITARGAPADTRVVNTLRIWGVEIDTIIFLGGLPKVDFIRAFRAQIFFDDQRLHLTEVSKYIPSGQVPYSSDSKLNNLEQ